MFFRNTIGYRQSGHAGLETISRKYGRVADVVGLYIGVFPHMFFIMSFLLG